MDKRNLPSLLLAQHVCCTSALLLWCGWCGCSLASCLHASSSSSLVEASCCQREGHSRTGHACASHRAVSSKLLILTVVWQEHGNQWHAPHISFSRATGRPVVGISSSFPTAFVPWVTAFTLFFVGLWQRKWHETDRFSCQQCSKNMLLHTTHFQMRQSSNPLEIRRLLSLWMKGKNSWHKTEKRQKWCYTEEILQKAIHLFLQQQQNLPLSEVMQSYTSNGKVFQKYLSSSIPF